MFDEINNEPEDVFANTDAVAPQIISPTQSAPEVLPQPQPIMATTPLIASSPILSAPTSGIEDRAAQLQSKNKAFPIKAVLFFVAIVVVIVLAYFLSRRILNSRTPITPEAPQVTNEQNPASTPSAPTVPVITQVETSAPEESTIDSDKDGLIDSRETELGLNPTNPDTDADGLFDREEVDVYHTNPLNPDTDADGYKDGDEIQKGYNPNGQGKLLEIPTTK